MRPWPCSEMDSLKGQRWLLLVAILYALNACAAKEGVVPIATELDSREVPVVAEVLEDANDGNTLSLRGKIEKHADIPDNQILLQLSAYRDGQEVAVFKEVLSKLRLPEGEPDRFQMQVSAAGATDYQLEILWGEDAERRRPKPVASAQLHLGG
jgi:hypothetical protein